MSNRMHSVHLRALFMTGALLTAGVSLPAVAQDQGPILAVSGPLFDPFFAAVKLGMDDAAKDLGVTYEYLTLSDANNIVPDFTRLAQQAFSRKPTAVIIGDFFPDALNPVIKEGVAGGVPAVLFNSGAPFWKELGAVGFIGEDGLEMGKAAGAFASEKKVKNGLCVNQVPGNPVLEQRCKGYIDTIASSGGKGSTLTIPTADANNQTAVLNAIKGALQSDASIDGIFTLGASQAVTAIQAANELGRGDKITIGTTDLSNADLQALKDGKLLFVIDQQPYLQGYYSILIATQSAKIGVHPVGQIQTGPLVITKDNVDAVIKANKDFPGSRGAS